MNDRSKIAWLYRRAGFGLGPGQLDQLEAKGAEAALDELVDPDAHGIPPAKDPWEGVTFDESRPDQRRDVTAVLVPWFSAMVSTPRPLQEWMRWFWHGHFVSTLSVVKRPSLLVDQLRLFGQKGLGDFGTLLREVSIDPAMLVYLDGIHNKLGAVNENYGRELLELFALGIGNYSEADVRAGAESLSGWTLDRASGKARFNPRQHDDTRHLYLGHEGVHDLDTVLEAVLAHQACASFITRKLAKAILGPGVDGGLVDRLAGDFRSNGMQLKGLVRSILEAGMSGATGPLVLSPVPWLAGAVRALDAPRESALVAARIGLAPAGQVPLAAPNVAGWPGGKYWLTSSATVARFNMASTLASAAPADGPALAAATRGDAAGLADALGHPEGFGPPTSGALDQVRSAGAKSVLTIALSSPEAVLA